MTDAKGAQELLTEFQQTGRQAAFEEIARRYAGMVYNVAYQVTRDAHDAEDATQATFLTLAVHAKTAGKIRYVGPWLRKVSHRLALDIRRSKKRRKAREDRHASENGHNGNGHNGNGYGPITEVPVSNGMQMEELRHILREELDKLPSKYRMPLILYYFGGLSPEEMGKELKVNTSTLGVRLHRGRKMLAESLSGRGVTINAAMIGAMLTGLVDTFVRDNLVHSASHAAVRVAAMGGMPDGTVVSGPILAMIRSATSAIRIGRLKGIIAAAILVATTLAGGAQLVQKFDLLDPAILEKLNLMRFVRPMMDRLLAPRLRAESNSAGTPNNCIVDATPSTDVGGFTSTKIDLSLAPSLSAADDLMPFEAIPTRIGVASVESELVNASRFKPTPANAGTSAPVAFVAPAPAPSSTFQLQPRLPAATAPRMASASVAVASPAPQMPDTAMVVDRASGTGAAEFHATPGSVISVKQFVVGQSTVGNFFQTNARVHASNSVIVADQPGSAGTYNLSGASELTTPNLVVGKGGVGTFNQNGSQVVVANAQHTASLTIAQDSGSKGSYQINNGGKLYADQILVGDRGAGLLQQKDSTVAVNWAKVGNESTGQGEWTVTNGAVQLGNFQAAVASGEFTNALVSTAQAPMPPPTPVFEVGRNGSGTVVLRSDSAIQELPGIKGSALVVRSNESGQGVLRGYGKVNLSGPVVQNGQIVADGFGAKHSLDLSTAQLVTNTIDNRADGHNGWYTRAGGSILLPAIKITGDRAYTWGEEQYDTQIDLVNSVRFRPHGAQVDAGNGSISISLVDPSSASVTPLPDGREALSLWKLDGTIDLGGIDLMVRYDDLAAAAAHVPEADLGLWVYEGGDWQALSDASAGIDLARHLIWGSAQGSPSYFATSVAGQHGTVVTPEPSTVGLFGLSLSAFLLRRRLRRVRRASAAF